MPEVSKRRRDVSDEYLKWQFSKKAKAKGVYKEYKPIPFTNKLVSTTVLYPLIHMIVCLSTS